MFTYLLIFCILCMGVAVEDGDYFNPTVCCHQTGRGDLDIDCRIGSLGKCSNISFNRENFPSYQDGDVVRVTIGIIQRSIHVNPDIQIIFTMDGTLPDTAKSLCHFSSVLAIYYEEENAKFNCDMTFSKELSDWSTTGAISYKTTTVHQYTDDLSEQSTSQGTTHESTTEHHGQTHVHVIVPVVVVVMLLVFSLVGFVVIRIYRRRRQQRPLPNVDLPLSPITSATSSTSSTPSTPLSQSLVPSTSTPISLFEGPLGDSPGTVDITSDSDVIIFR
ncbi:hypothetical protein ScPMuIL_006763 [Solemya velum]